MFAAEINVVAQRRLWPRALLTPFTDRVRLTPADRRAHAAYAHSKRHKGFEVIDVGFETPAGRHADVEGRLNHHSGG